MASYYDDDYPEYTDRKGGYREDDYREESSSRYLPQQYVPRRVVKSDPYGEVSYARNRGRSSGRSTQKTHTASVHSSGGRSNREKQQVRKQIIVTGALFCAVFAAMVIYTASYAASHEADLFSNDYNGREEILLAQNTRGNIYASDGQVLATSVIDAEGNQTRTYPFGNLFSHVVGYTAKGGSGIEQLYNYQLVHSDITLNEKADFDSRGAYYPGNDVYTTLDPALQQSAYDALGESRGAIIVTEADTGRVLAQVSKPDFNPGSVEEDWDRLLSDNTSGTFVNRATQGLYAPGSTFKILDTIEFLKEDITNNDNYSFDCNGGVTFTDPVSGEATIINCYHWEVHGHLNLKESFAESCNSSFGTIGNQLDRDSYNATLKDMMFNEKLPYDLPSEVSTYVLDADTSTREVLQLAIGQGQTLMTPLHLNMITAAIANGGKIYKPYVVESVKTGTGTVLEQTKPTEYKTVMSPEIANLMQDYCRETVLDGTATKMKTRPYNAAGKTGTAEYSSDKSNSNAWFTGYAYDSTHGMVAITVVIERVGGSGGSYAVPAARQVLDTYFGYTPKPGEDDDANYIHVINDHNNDGIPDGPATTSAPKEEMPENVVALNVDTNGDGIMDAIDFNNDGVIDSWDLDGDGVPESNMSAEDAEAAAQAAQAAEEAAAQAVEEAAAQAAQEAEAAAQEAAAQEAPAETPPAPEGEAAGEAQQPEAAPQEAPAEPVQEPAQEAAPEAGEAAAEAPVA